MTRLTQSQLRSLINEALGDIPEETASGKSRVYPEMGKRLAETFLAMLGPEPQILSDLERELNHSFDQDSFFPGRIEDIEPMAMAAAREAAPIVARSPEFIGFLGDALARMFRKTL